MPDTVSPDSVLNAAAVDHVLTTTRAVRRRLDLDRPVDNQLLIDCIDIAEQAPTGGGLGSRRWIVIREPEIKAQLAEVYRDQAGAAMSAMAERLRGSGHPQEKMVESAAFLAEHLAEVPALVIPTIIGRHDGSGRPGLFDSVIQAAWSFCLAVRARGLGTTWVTAALQDETAVKEILGIPEHMTEIVLLPVAHTRGEHFRPAKRHPARSITYFDRFGITTERGPDAKLRFADGPGAIAEVDIDAPPATVWSLVTDVEVPTRFSDEAASAAWRDDRRGVGAIFDGHNRVGETITWTTACYVDARDDERTFGWRTTDPDTPGARWRFDLEPVGAGTRLRYVFTVGPGPSGLTAAIEQDPDHEHDVIRRRVAGMRTNMQRTVDGIKALAESGGDGDVPTRVSA